MKNAIASVEIFAHEPDEGVRRLTLVIDQPRRRDGTNGADGWVCRVALADEHRPLEITATDSVAVLVAALDQADRWLGELENRGIRLTRDRAGAISYSLAPELLADRYSPAAV